MRQLTSLNNQQKPPFGGQKKHPAGEKRFLPCGEIFLLLGRFFQTTRKSRPRVLVFPVRDREGEIMKFLIAAAMALVVAAAIAATASITTVDTAVIKRDAAIREILGE